MNSLCVVTSLIFMTIKTPPTSMISSRARITWRAKKKKLKDKTKSHTEKIEPSILALSIEIKTISHMKEEEYALFLLLFSSSWNNKNGIRRKREREGRWKHCFLSILNAILFNASILRALHAINASNKMTYTNFRPICKCIRLFYLYFSGCRDM